MKSCLAAALLSVACGAVRAAPAPCEAPDRYVSARAAGEVAPLVRPFVLGGIAVVAVRRAGDERWLELAAASVGDARTQLERAAAGGELVKRDGRVWLRCPSGAGARA